MTKKSILVVDDHDDIRLALSVLLKQAGFEVIEAISPYECERILEQKTPSLILLDMNFSRDTTSGKEGLSLLNKIKVFEVPMILMTAWSHADLIVEGIKLGAVDFIEKPWNKTSLINKIKSHALVADTPKANNEWIASSAEMQTLEQRIQQFAATDANVLILGENGTGKSLLAKRIHQLSNRKDKPFVSMNMAAIPDSLFESELFGHRRGAFTDAKQDRQGVFSRASGGTLFMDEIGTLPLNSQPKLLQVLETGEFIALGAEKSESADVRLIAATNQDLAKAINQGSFRQDLFYRLNTFVINIPALRQRKEDIPKLAKQFLTSFATKYKKQMAPLSEQALEKLLVYHWPGNIRELSHVMERAVLISNVAVIQAKDILLDSPANISESLSDLTLEQLEKQRITESLNAHHGKITAAAQELGISRHALARRMDKYKLEGVDE